MSKYERIGGRLMPRYRSTALAPVVAPSKQIDEETPKQNETKPPMGTSVKAKAVGKGMPKTEELKEYKPNEKYKKFIELKF